MFPHVLKLYFPEVSMNSISFYIYPVFLCYLIKSFVFLCFVIWISFVYIHKTHTHCFCKTIVKKQGISFFFLFFFGYNRKCFLKLLNCCCIVRFWIYFKILILIITSLYLILWIRKSKVGKLICLAYLQIYLKVRARIPDRSL